MRRRLTLVAALTALAAVLPPLVVPLWSPGSSINCSRVDINVRSGHLRRTQLLWFLRVSTRIEDTPVSLALARSPDAAAWQPVRTDSLRSSTDHDFAQAPEQAHRLEQLAQDYRFDDAAKRMFAVSLSYAWEVGGVSLAEKTLKTYAK